MAHTVDRSRARTEGIIEPLTRARSGGITCPEVRSDVPGEAIERAHDLCVEKDGETQDVRSQTHAAAKDVLETKLRCDVPQRKNGIVHVAIETWRACRQFMPQGQPMLMRGVKKKPGVGVAASYWNPTAMVHIIRSSFT